MKFDLNEAHFGEFVQKWFLQKNLMNEDGFVTGREDFFTGKFYHGFVVKFTDFTGINSIF